MSPAGAFPRKRGRPGEGRYHAVRALPVDTSPDPASERALIQEVVWNAETTSIRILLNWEILASGLRKLSPDVSAENTDWDE